MEKYTELMTRGTEIVQEIIIDRNKHKIELLNILNDSSKDDTQKIEDILSNLMKRTTDNYSITVEEQNNVPGFVKQILNLTTPDEDFINHVLEKRAEASKEHKRMIENIKTVIKSDDSDAIKVRKIKVECI